MKSCKIKVVFQGEIRSRVIASRILTYSHEKATLSPRVRISKFTKTVLLALTDDDYRFSHLNMWLQGHNKGGGTIPNAFQGDEFFVLYFEGWSRIFETDGRNL